MPALETVPGECPMRWILALPLAAALAGCSQAPMSKFETSVVSVASPAPYRFISYSLNDTAETRRQVRAHNRAHQAVLDAAKP